LPRYFFDIASVSASRDGEGEDLPGRDAALAAAIRIASELLPIHNLLLERTGRIAMVVRDEAGVILHELECRLTSPPSPADSR
jgi:hypothetical protein